MPVEFLAIYTFLWQNLQAHSECSIAHNVEIKLTSIVHCMKVYPSVMSDDSVILKFEIFNIMDG